MDSNRKNAFTETTKEVFDLKALTSEALDSMAEEYKEEDSLYEEPLEKLKIETESEIEVLQMEEKENIWKKLQKKWTNLPKKNKIIWIGAICLVLAVIIGLIVFFVMNKDEEKKPSPPDLILEMDNYRYDNGRLIFIQEDQELGTYECENKNENLCKLAPVRFDETMDEPKYQTKDKETLELHSKIYKDRYVFIFDNKSEADSAIKLYDFKNQEIVETAFDIVTFIKFENHVSLKNSEGHYSLLEFTDDDITTIIGYDSKYDEIHLIPDDTLNTIVVKKDNNSYLASLENKILTKAFNKTIVGANNTYIKTKENDKYNVYDYNAKEIWEESADYIELLDNIMIVVNAKNLSVYDYEKNPLIGTSLELKNENYNAISIYHENKIVETKKSFDYELYENTLNIYVYDGDEKENKSYNLNEGILSTRLSFMNYFDGTIYFYADQEKTKLMGTYPCSNRNNIEKDTQELTNCTIATESFYRETIGNEKEKDASNSLGSIPLIGKEYAFIKDGDTIVLYNILPDSQKVIAKYESVDTSSYTNTKEITFVDTSNLVFIAKSKSSSKFGVAEITPNGVNPVIPFEYESIKLLGNYYVIQDENGYSLYTLEGEKKTEDKNSPIVDYHKNYLKTFKDNVYFVHAFDKSISDKAYNYIELYDKYYAAVINDKVHLFDYENNEITQVNEEESGVPLHIDTYYGSDVNAFKITFSNDYAHIEIGNTAGSYDKAKSFSLKIQEEGVKPEVNDKEESESKEENKEETQEGSEENES